MYVYDVCTKVHRTICTVCTLYTGYLVPSHHQRTPSSLRVADIERRAAQMQSLVGGMLWCSCFSSLHLLQSFPHKLVHVDLCLFGIIATSFGGASPDKRHGPRNN